MGLRGVLVVKMFASAYFCFVMCEVVYTDTWVCDWVVVNVNLLKPIG